MMIAINSVFKLIYCLIVVFTSSSASDVTINTPLGDIKGELSDNNLVTFKGIPYVENQPIGNYRFGPSEVKTTPYSNSTTSPYDAKSFSPACPNFGDPSSQEISESCLYLNIFTKLNGNNLPVIVYIHGGGFIGGSGTDPLLNANDPPFIYHPTKDVIYVSFNYRVGGLGFLPLTEIFEETEGKTNGGLNGILDQITALKWIKNNIEYFGGNKNKITLYGISAGGESICHLLVSPNAKGLFNSVISSSAPCVNTPTTKNIDFGDGIRYGLQTLSDEGLPNTLEELRALPFEDIVGAFIKKSTIDGPVHNKVMSFDSKTILPIDGYVLPLELELEDVQVAAVIVPVPVLVPVTSRLVMDLVRPVVVRVQAAMALVLVKIAILFTVYIIYLHQKNY